MLQVELYVDGVEEPAALFTEIFGFVEIEHKVGWRNVQYKDAYQIMLFDPFKNQDHETDWAFLPPSQTGHGMQIVLTVEDAKTKRRLLEGKRHLEALARWP